jgi:flagella synthesis protein FlgN
MQPAVSLADLLAEEVREVGGFVELLRQEQSLLASSGNADALLPLVDQKSNVAASLRGIGERREQYLAARRFKPGREGMEACLKAAPDGKALQGLWQQLLVLAKEARALNETNGKLITIHWQHNQQALTALMSATSNAMVYGPDGQQSGSSGTRRFLSSA